MSSDRQIEKLIEIFRKQGAVLNPPKIKLAEMITSKNCKIGELIVDEGDYWLSERLQGKLSEGDDVIVYRLDDDSFVIIDKVVKG